MVLNRHGINSTGTLLTVKERQARLISTRPKWNTRKTKIQRCGEEK